MSKRYIEVIVSDCSWNDYQSWLRGSDPLRTHYDSHENAKAFALSQRGEGKSVIIRPSFNEKHLGDRLSFSFREWRSINGELFSEIHFSRDQTSSQVRLDTEIILPSIPKGKVP
jgi:hypothetical protein